MKKKKINSSACEHRMLDGNVDNDQDDPIVLPKATRCGRKVVATS